MRIRFICLAAIGLCISLVASHSSTQNITQPQISNLEIPNNVAKSAPEQTESEHLLDFPAPMEGAIGPVEYPANVNPLTGLVVDDASILERRPIDVKISNAPPIVRPQAGIGQADIVFEHYAEGGLTRFSAIFYGQTPTRVGSIRSARLIDHEIVPMIDGMLVFSGGSIGVETYIYGSDVIDPDFQHAPHRFIPPSEYADRAYKGVLYGPPYYWRDNKKPIPHNLFANLEVIWQLAAGEDQNTRPNLHGMAFHPDPPEDESGTVSDIEIRYRATRVRWVYDPTMNHFLRYSDGQPHLDANTNRQVSADNVVIMYSEHVDTEIIESQWQGSISWSTQIQMWDQQPVILFRDGKRYDGYWTRTVRENLISLRTEAGELLYLKPGVTWFQIVRLPEQQNPDEEWIKVQE